VLKNQCTSNLMKESGNKNLEQGESFADIQVPEDTSKPDQTPEAQNEVASDEAQDGSQ
jgi:hypothetical protein